MKLGASLAQILQLARRRARLELLTSTEGELASGLASNSAKHDAVQQRVTTQAVVAVDATSRLASNVKSRNDLARLLVNALCVHGALEPTHAVVDHGSNDRHVEGLGRHLGAIDDVVEELLAAARLAAGLVPSLAGRVSREGAAIGVLTQIHCSTL